MPTKLPAPQNLPPVAGTLHEVAASKAKVFGSYADTWSRLLMVAVIALIFVGLNWYVMRFIGKVFEADLELLRSGKTAQRVVTTEVLMSLIAGTVLQVGVAIIAIVSYLFPKTKSGAAD